MYRLFRFCLLAMGTALSAAPAPGIHFAPYSGERAYGLAVIPPWPDGGRLIIDFPEHLDALDAGGGDVKILHYFEKQNLTRWQVAADGLSALLDVQSPFAPGVLIHARAQAVGQDRMEFVFTIENRSDRTLRWIDPLFCHRLGKLTGFPEKASKTPTAFSNFEHVYAVVNGQVLRVSTVSTRQPQSRVRGAEVAGSPQPANPFAESRGGVLPSPVDAAIAAVTSSDGRRKLILSWTPGKSFLSNAEIPCLHADPFYGVVEPGRLATARGLLIMTERPLEPIMLELLKLGRGALNIAKAGN